MYLFCRISDEGIRFIPLQGDEKVLPLDQWSADLGIALQEMACLVDRNIFYSCAVMAIDLRMDDYHAARWAPEHLGYQRMSTEDASRLMKEFGAWPGCIPLVSGYHLEFSDLWTYGQVVLHPHGLWIQKR